MSIPIQNQSAEKVVEVTLWVRLDVLQTSFTGTDETLIKEIERYYGSLVQTNMDAWTRFPVWVQMEVRINGKKYKVKPFVAENMQHLAEQATIVVVGKIRNPASQG